MGPVMSQTVDISIYFICQKVAIDFCYFFSVIEDIVFTEIMK